MLIFKGDDLFNSIKGGGGGGAVIKKTFKCPLTIPSIAFFLCFILIHDPRISES